jgi:hypothetical protein
MGFQLLRHLVAEHQIHAPGQKQIIDGGHQLEAIAVRELLAFKAEVEIRARPKRPMAREPNNHSASTWGC